LRRGGNLAARASAGSRKTLAYTLGILDRIRAEGSGEEDEEEEQQLRVLILTPPGEAERLALSMVPYAQAVGLQVAVPGGAWGTPLSEAHVVIAGVGPLMQAIQASELKLDHLEAAVIDGGAVILDLGEWEKVDAVLDLAPRDAQRVVFSSAFPEEVEDLVARRVKRAIRYPPEPALAEDRAQPTHGEIGFVLATEREKLDLLTRQLGGSREPGAPPIIFCRSDERAADLAERLAIRGFLVGSADDEDADVAVAAAGVSRSELLEEADGEVGQTISYDVPPDADTLTSRHSGDPNAVVLVEPRELAHLREIASQAGFRVRSAPLPDQRPAATADIESFRAELRQAIREEDLTPQMLLLEPLFEEFTAGEIAAAATALLRSRRRRPLPPTPTEAPPATLAPQRPAEAASAPTGPAPVTWARLFVSVGSRDDVRPGDLVGTLAGEADIPGSRIGKIEIRDSFSIVEVQADVAEKVIRAVNGKTLKGRSLRVDFDRGGPARRPPTRGGLPPRRTTRRPPRDNG